MKYYLYISDAKVDMLFPQIPHDTKKKTAIEFGIDLKIINAKRKSESESESNRVSRLEAVIGYLRKHRFIGGAEKPRKYVAGTLEMRMWTGTRLVYCVGGTDNSRIVLFGSPRHLIGELDSKACTEFTSSRLWAAIENLAWSIKEEFLNPDPDERDFLAQTGLIPSDVSHRAKNFALIPHERLEFVAKCLTSIPSTDAKGSALIATPLYIAKVD